MTKLEQYKSGKMRMKAAIKFADEMDRVLLCTDKKFSGKVKIVHDDGSKLCIENASTVRYNREFIIVFAEHFNPMVFFAGDLKSFTKPRQRSQDAKAER